MKRYLAIVGACAVLAACGGGDDGPAPSSPMATVDSFVTRVMEIIAGTSDTTEPVPIDAVTATTPETTEPSPVS